MFGRKSEKRLPGDDQPSLFDAAGVEIPAEQQSEPAEEAEGETVTYTRKKSQKGTETTSKGIFVPMDNGCGMPD